MFDLGLDKGIFNYATSAHNGTAILQTSNTWEIQRADKLFEGRVIIATITHKREKLRLVNLYTPAHPQQRQTFFNDLAHTLLLDTDKQNFILAGDFNVTLEDRDIVGQRGDRQYGRKELEHIVSTLDLQDAYRRIQPDNYSFTYRHRHLARTSRIDRFYIPRNIKISAITHMEHTLTYTDHKGVYIKLGDRQKIGKTPHWKFNDLLLEDQQFLESVRQSIQHTRDNTEGNIHTRMDGLRDSINPFQGCK